MKIPPHDSLAWDRIAPYLDRALDLEPQERETWINELTTTEPDIAQAVRQFIHERDVLDAKGFLENSPTAKLTTLTGAHVGAYTIERLLGRGGMGEVWLAARNDGRFEGKCAVKFLDSSIASPKLVDRFRREGHLLARLTHPNIARLIDAGATVDDKPYLALEYVDGERIDRYCESKALSIEDRVRLFIDVVAAVAHAHAHLIIHRDLKPTNVLVTRDGQVKLLDFGIAKLLSAETVIDGTALTKLEDVALTPEYAAPEQMLGETPSTATDVYQLGMLLYVLLTGKHPLQLTGTRSEKVRAALDGVVPRASDVADTHTRKKLQGDLDAILATALRKGPNERYATAQALQDELFRYLNQEPVAARRGATWYRARKFVGRHRLAVVGAIVSVSALIAALLFAVGQMREAQQQRDQARFEVKRADTESEFMYIMMSEIGAPGNPVTPEKVLEKGLSVLTTRYSDDPEFLVTMLRRIAGQINSLGDRQRAYDTLIQAESIARQHGLFMLLAEVQCATVSTEIALGHTDRAAAHLAEGRNLLAHTAQVPVAAELACLQAEVVLSTAAGKLQDALHGLERSVEVFVQNGLTAEDRYSEVLGQLGTLYTSLGNTRKGYEFAHNSRLAMERNGRGGSIDVLVQMHNEAIAQSKLGELRAAFDAESEVLKRRMARSPDAALSPGVSLAYASFLIRLDRATEALPWITRGESDAARTGNRAAKVAAHMQRARAMLALSRLDEATAELMLVADAANQDATAIRDPVTRALIARAELLYMQGKLDDARQHIESVLIQTRDTDLGLEFYCPLALIPASQIAVAQGRHAAAESYASEALRIYESRARDPAQSADVGEAALRLAEAKRLLNDRSGALALASRAVTSLKNALGDEHSLTRAARALESELYDANHQRSH